MASPSNIVLIGMPGSGKSTVGVLLAKEALKNFVDTDLVIQIAEGRPLQHIVDREGYLALRKIEEQTLLNLHFRNTVVATGGSAAYSDPAMCHLKEDALVVFLNVQLATLRRRVHNYDTRGIARRPDQSFEDLFEERFKLYSRYADLTLASDEQRPEETVNAVLGVMRAKS